MEDEIFDILYDFADCLGAEKVKEFPTKENRWVVGKISNGDNIYLEYSEYTKPKVLVYMGRPDGLGDCSFAKNTDVSKAVSMLVSNYIGKRSNGLTQADLNWVSEIKLPEVRDAVDMWLS